ncbi:MAG: lipoxygenase family protein [Proteobacteria bacterium]|nr:lipoxygenase family protein [Pseudomonadota bacterium]
MSAYLLPQNDDREKRAAELFAAGSKYKYNTDIGIPLIDAEGPDDANKLDWKIKIFALLLRLRKNVQAICDKSGLKFQESRPVRDIPKLVAVLTSGGDTVEYFTPDLGFVASSQESRPKSIKDYTDKIFVDRDQNNRGTAPLPEMAHLWDSDLTFAYNFLAGPNPAMLQRFTPQTKPVDFDLTTVDLGSLSEFGGDTMERAIREGRVYFVDHTDLRAIFAHLPNAPAPNAAPRTFKSEVSGDWKYMYAPYAVFVVPPDAKHMLPVAIRCGLKTEGNHIYTPRDGYSWRMARVCMLAAHNNHHEVISHLGLTHLLIDPICMATRLRLHSRHPVYRLLNPHFEGTASVNIGARTSLILPERSVDRLVGSKIERNYPYLQEQRLGYSFRGNFPKVRAASRGVDDASLLPNYPYREDAALIWDAIHSWVSDYVSIWYHSEADIRADYELQAWANEINDNGKVKDFCLSGGGVHGRDDLIDLLTMTIFTAGPQHAAVNFPQGREMLFVPVNPMAGYAPAPMGHGHTEADFLSILPPLDVAVQTWSVLNLLAGVNNTRLGDYRGAFLTHPVSEAYNLKFKANLLMIEGKINSANRIRRGIYGLDYVHLLPSRIPASINI